jgi:hypothetical protein
VAATRQTRFPALSVEKKAQLELSFELFGREVGEALALSEQLDAAMDNLAALALLVANRQLDAAETLLN